MQARALELGLDLRGVSCAEDLVVLQTRPAGPGRSRSC